MKLDYILEEAESNQVQFIEQITIDQVGPKAVGSILRQEHVLFIEGPYHSYSLI